MRRAHQLALLSAIVAAVGPGISSRLARADLTAVVDSPGNTQIKLSQVVNLGSGLVPIDAATIAGNPNLYVGTYVASSAQILAVDPVSGTKTPFLSFTGTGVPITGQGLQGITFSPNFTNSSAAGYHKFYTYEDETAPSNPANIMFLHPEVPNPATAGQDVGVIREWTANADGTAIDTSVASRVVFNFGTPAGHMGGGMKFGPDGLLYLATGDGGGNGHGGATNSATDGFTGKDPAGTANDVPGISNGQDFTNVLGKVIRIDPYVTNANGTPRTAPGGETAKSFGGGTAYFIPSSNPFVNNTQNIFFAANGIGQTPLPPLPELYAIGFRNPWKMSFDKLAVAGDGPLVANVGDQAREEIDQVQAGKNYGWPYREGDATASAASGRPLNGGLVPFLSFNGSTYVQAAAGPLTDPTQMQGPKYELFTRSGTNSANLMFTDRPGNDLNGDGIFGNNPDDGDANAIVGGFIYRGSLIPQLYGKYVFGAYQYLITDTTRDPAIFPAISMGGRLLYADTDNTIKEFNFDTGFGISNSFIPGTFSNIGDLMGVVQGDNGELYAMFLNGDIKAILPSAAPEPASLAVLGSGVLMLLRRKRKA